MVELKELMPRVRMTELSVFSVTRSCSEGGVISRLLAENTKRVYEIQQ